jgi:hypothetical protein
MNSTETKVRARRAAIAARYAPAIVQGDTAGITEKQSNSAIAAAAVGAEAVASAVSAI